jgi:molybdenum cofactor guanylyltransferase
VSVADTPRIGPLAAGTHAPAPVSALVLAGGRSARMQRDKALLEYDGETQLARTWRLVREYAPESFVSVRPEQAHDPSRAGYPQVVDSLPGIGPAAGILAAFAARPSRAWLVVAIDLPLLDLATLEALFAAREPSALATAFTSAHDGLPEPLCAIWEPGAAAPLAAFVAAGRHCPRKFLITHGARLLPLPRAAALDNVNTPAEYAAVRERTAGAAPGLAETTR